MGEMGAAAAGAFAAYEMHEAKVDPTHARRHKLEAEVAGATALGSAGYAYHEHREKKKSEHILGGPNEGSYFSTEQHQTLGGPNEGVYYSTEQHHKHHHHGHGKKHHLQMLQW